MNVRTFLTDKLKTPDAIGQYVKSAMIYYGEIPFLYSVFDITNVRSAKEKGGYAVVSRFTPYPNTPGLTPTHRPVTVCSDNKQSSTPCLFTTPRGSNRPCQRFLSQGLILSVHLLSFALRYVVSTHPSMTRF